MANVSFKKGLLANLPAAISEGTFYITTDERAMYLDVDSTTRVRIGDFQEFATLTALQANTNPSTTALYYVTELNVLAKWDGTKYVQINLDTGATSAEATGNGNALDGVSYDPATRKLTFTKTKTFTTASDVDSQIAAKVGDLTLGDVTYETVKAYVDKKTDGIATDAALETLTHRVTTAEADIDTLQGDKTVAGSVDKKIDDAITALDLANTYDPKGAADAKDAAIAAAKKAGDDAQADVDALEALVGAVTEGKTVVEMIADAQSAAEYDDTALKARVSANETAISTLNGDATTVGSVAKQVSDAVAKIVADAPEAYDTLKEISDWISSHASDASAMNSQITTNKTDIAALKALVGTLPESAEATTIVGYIDEVVAGLAIGDYAKAADLTAAITRIAALESKAHEHSNKDVLDGITAAKVAAWDAAEQNAKDYADQKVAALDKADTAVNGQYVSAVSETDGVITVTRAALPDYSETYDAKGAADDALTDAKAYTDTALTWGSF